MTQIADREARNRFGQVLDAAQRSPVRVTKKGRPVGVMMSKKQYERLRGAAWERLATAMDATSEEASASGSDRAQACSTFGGWELNVSSLTPIRGSLLD